MALTQAQIDFFWDHGYLVVEDVINQELLGSLRADFAAMVEDSKQHSEAYGETIDGRARYDLEPGHSAAKPGLRRVNAPVEVADSYYKASMDSGMTDCVADLIGPNVKFHHAKINSKLPGGNTLVKWHQDFPFTPHSNDDLVTALLLVDDVTDENGPLKVVAGSHKKDIHSLWHDGVFTGAIDNDMAQWCEDNAVICKGKGGSAVFMHTRTLHGSSVNKSANARTIHISVFSAEDAIACSPNPVPNKYQGLVVRGEATGRIRTSDFAMEMPAMPEKASFFSQQEHHDDAA